MTKCKDCGKNVSWILSVNGLCRDCYNDRIIVNPHVCPYNDEHRFPTYRDLNLHVKIYCPDKTKSNVNIFTLSTWIKSLLYIF